jgi:hypothetical protein
VLMLPLHTFAMSTGAIIVPQTGSVYSPPRGLPYLPGRLDAGTPVGGTGLTFTVRPEPLFEPLAITPSSL